MTERERNRFRRKLLAERERIEASMKAMGEEVLYQPTGTQASDEADFAEAGTDSFDRDVVLTIVGDESAALREIDAALDRIEKGTYGICEGSGKPIPKKRLEVFPWARYCVEYQAELERQRR
jgi:RNA polymerase-binding protein DksA